MVPTLREVQLALRDAITRGEPSTEDGLARLAAIAATISVAGDSRLSAARRIAIYVDMHFTRIRDTIAEDQPALARALGTTGFDRMVRRYLTAFPPSDPSLRHVTANVADFLAADRSEEISPWLVALARFERRLVDAFDAPDEVVLERSDLETLPAERWADLGILPVRSQSTDSPGFEVDALRARLLSGEPSGEALPWSGTLRVWRQGVTVFHSRPEALDAEALEHCASGLAFADLCDWLAGRDDVAEPAAVAVRLLDRWIADGLLVAGG